MIPVTCGTVMYRHFATITLIPSLTRLPARCYKRVLCAEVCSSIEGLYADTQVFRRGQIGTPLYFDMPCGGSVFGTPVAARFAADGILQRAVNVPEQNHTS